MKIDINAIINEYEDLSDIIENEEEILSEVELSLKEITGLQEFTGKTADNVKEYCSMVHNEIIKTLKVILMEVNVKLYGTINDFSCSVDKSKNAIINSEYINSLKDKLADTKDDYISVNENISAIVNDASNYVSIGSDYSSSIKTGYENANTKAEDVIKSLERFDDAHSNDMKNVIDIIDNISSIIKNMMSITTPEGISVNIDTFTSNDNFKKLKEYQVISSNEVIETSKYVPDKYVKMIIDMAVPVGVFFTGADKLITIEDAIKLYSIGASFDVRKNEAGELVYKLITDEKNIPKIRKQLETLGLSHLSRRNISQMIRDGIKVVNKDGKFVNSKLVNQFKNNAGFKQAFNQISEGSINGPTKFSNTLKYVDKFGKVVTVVSNVPENIYNPMTGEWEWDNTEGYIDTAIDSAVEIGIDVGITTGAAALGQVLIPIPLVGAAVGTIVGTIVSTAVSTIKFGEPPKTLVDHGKDIINDITDDIGNIVAKVFW